MNLHFQFRKEAKYKSKLLKSPICNDAFLVFQTSIKKKKKDQLVFWLDQIFFN